MTDQTSSFPEPPDGTILYWPADSWDEGSVVAIRDDANALPGEPEARWAAPCTAALPITFAELLDRAEPMDAAVRLYREDNDAIAVLPEDVVPFGPGERWEALTYDSTIDDLRRVQLARGTLGINLGTYSWKFDEAERVALAMLAAARSGRRLAARLNATQDAGQVSR